MSRHSALDRNLDEYEQEESRLGKLGRLFGLYKRRQPSADPVIVEFLENIAYWKKATKEWESNHEI